MYKPLPLKKLCPEDPRGYCRKKSSPVSKARMPQTVSFIGSEDAEELVQDSIAMAVKLLHNVDKAHKKVTPGNIAYYTIQHMKSGRRSF